MKAEAEAILEIFDKQMRIEVPMFQRQYVWNKEHQWEPLWEDIARKFDDYLTGRRDAPIHFLGAMVLDLKQTPTTHVEKRQVIDGQQRLTTLQIFLAAFRDFCRERGCDSQAEDAEVHILNRKPMDKAVEERFKVWPTQLDRAQFIDVLTAGSRLALEKLHPEVWRKRAKKANSRPRMVEAYLFFHDSFRAYFEGTPDEPPIAAEKPLEERIESCLLALKNALKVVIVDLESGDDAQIIFETLNARGEPLLPADLLRNFIFLRAARLNENVELLYSKYWQAFDDEFWRDEVVQGRLTRPRSDLFMQHYLASRKAAEIPIRHLFVEYKHWVEKDRPFPTVEAEVSSLSRQGKDFRRIVAPTNDDPLRGFMEFLELFDIRTGYPLLLFLFDAKISEGEWATVAQILESYLLRRGVCGLSTKAYNRIFLTLTKSLQKCGPSANALKQALLELSGDSSIWPTDEAFSFAWQTGHAYRTLNNPKIVHVLKRINAALYNSRHESFTFAGSLTVEHIMPQNWVEHWKLSDGQSGMEFSELLNAAPEDNRGAASKRRNSLLQTFGNLTIITQPLNSSVSNSAWLVKRPELMHSSLLPINSRLSQIENWDDEAIETRGKMMLEVALRLWPRG